MSWVNCDPMSRMRIREVTSEFPLRCVEVEKLHLSGIEVENRRAGRPVQPAACLAGIHYQRIALRLHGLLMRKPVHDEAVRLHGAFLDFADVMHEQNAMTRHLEAVRRLEDLQA